MPVPEEGANGATGGGHVAEDLFGDRDSDDEDPTVVPLLESRRLVTSSAGLDVDQQHSDLKIAPEVAYSAEVMEIVEREAAVEERDAEDPSDINKASYKRQRDE